MPTDPAALRYAIPASLEEDISRLERGFAEFRAGRLHEIAFTAKRVKMGVYLERNCSTYMCRIRCAGNIVTPTQLAKAGELARKYGEPRAHVTTRAEIQLHGIKEEDVAAVLRELKAVGLACLGGSGNTIRNLVANHDSGISPQEVFDVQPCIVALTSRLLAEPDNWELVRKIKIAFASRPEEAAFCRFQDLSFIACLNAAGQRGFQVYAGGGLGSKPKAAVLLQDFLPEQDVHCAVRAVKNLHHRLGNRKNKHRNRIKFLLHEDLGEAAFRRHYEEELVKTLAQEQTKLDIRPIDNAANLGRSFDLEPLFELPAGFALWRQRNVADQKQAGLCSIKLPLRLGDLAAEDCLRLTKALQPFGDNTLRCGTDQNLHLRNIPERFLPNLFQAISSCRTLSEKPSLYGNLVSCSGVQTCQVGITRPRPAAEAIFKALDQTDFPLPDDVQIRISGCPNACANHWLGDLAFCGRVRHIQGRPIPTYNVFGNGGIRQGRVQLGEQIGWVHSFDLPRFVVDALRLYAERKAADPAIDFSGWWNNGGEETLIVLCKAKCNAIPSFAEDKNYYFDHGAEQIFSGKELGRAEGSVGMCDMIEVEGQAIKKLLHELAVWKPGKGSREAQLREVLLCSARMLLAAKGEEPHTEQETCSLFDRHVLAAGIVSAEHRRIIELACQGIGELEPHADKVLALGRAIIELQQKMDGAMLALSRTEIPPARPAAETAAAAAPTSSRADRFKDLSGVRCPLNFAKAKVELAAMQSGQTLELILDDGHPVENVPGSVQREGHRVVAQEKIGAQWRVLIQKR